jgi:hypothetical protein
MLVYTLLAHKFRLHPNPHTRRQTHQSLSPSMTKFGGDKKEREEEKTIKLWDKTDNKHSTGKNCVIFPIIFHRKLFHYVLNI